MHSEQCISLVCTVLCDSALCCVIVQCAVRMFEVQRKAGKHDDACERSCFRAQLEHGIIHREV